MATISWSIKGRTVFGAELGVTLVIGEAAEQI